jgi:hypothetical protein
VLLVATRRRCNCGSDGKIKHEAAALTALVIPSAVGGGPSVPIRAANLSKKHRQTLAWSQPSFENRTFSTEIVDLNYLIDLAANVGCKSAGNASALIASVGVSISAFEALTRPHPNDLTRSARILPAIGGHILDVGMTRISVYEHFRTAQSSLNWIHTLSRVRDATQYETIIWVGGPKVLLFSGKISKITFTTPKFPVISNHSRLSN